MRTLLAGEDEGVCSGVGEGGTDCSGEIEGEGDSPGVDEGAGVGDSCASVADAAHTTTNTMCVWNEILLSKAQRN